MPPSEAIQHVTLYKLNTADASQLIMDGYTQVASGIQQVGEERVVYQLYFLQQGSPQPASWLGVFRPLVSGLPAAAQPKVLLPGFVLIAKIRNSIYGACGGLGHVQLKKQPIEPRFGINLAQKILSLPELKGLVQRDTGDEVHSLDRIFRATPDPRSDLNNLRRILTHIRGKLKKENEYCASIGKSIVAGDALSVNGKKSFQEIISFIVQVHKLFHASVPGIKIPQLEHINKRSQMSLLVQLEAELVTKLNSYDPDQDGSLFLDNVEIGYLPDRVEHYELSLNHGRYDAVTPDDIFRHVSALLRSLPEEERVAAFGRMSLRVQFDDGHYEKHPLSYFICGDLIYASEVYFRNNGLWFRAGQEYLRELDQQLNEVEVIPAEQLNLNEWDEVHGAMDEAEYNASHVVLHPLDGRLVHIPSERGGIEFCDLLSAINGGMVDVIHVKRAHGAKLRALFAQGYVSARLYSGSQEFRSKVHRAELSSTRGQALPAPAKAVLASLDGRHKRDIRVIFAIYDDSPSHSVQEGAQTISGHLSGTLTTFAKVDLFSRVLALRELGYGVAVTRIRPYPGTVTVESGGP